MSTPFEQAVAMIEICGSEGVDSFLFARTIFDAVVHNDLSLGELEQITARLQDKLSMMGETFNSELRG